MNAINLKASGMARAFTSYVPITSIVYGLLFRKSIGVYFGLYALFMDLLNHFIKKVFKTAYGERSTVPILGLGGRPEGAKFCGSFVNINKLGNGGKPSTFGMPSGHAQMAVITTVFWSMFLHEKYGWDLYNIFAISLLCAVSLGIMYSRCIFKCHTVQQVIVGGLFGIFFGFVGYKLYRMYF